MLRRQFSISVTRRTSLVTSGCASSSSFRFHAASATQHQVADMSPPTLAEKKIISQEVENARIDKFLDDMYTMPVFNPLVIVLTIVGFAGFFITWGYFVATPVYLAHVGKSSEESGKGGDASELD